MKTKWTEMNAMEKAITVASIVLGLVTLVFAILDIAELWGYANICWMITMGVLLGIESLPNWKEHRGMAIIELICGVGLLVVGIVSIFLK